MNKRKYLIIVLFYAFFVSCQDFLYPEQDLIIKKDDVPNDMIEMRGLSLGLYAQQQELVEQIVILGELRGDLLEVTENADPDLIEVNDFNISSENKYASPKGFYKLISASNNVIRVLKDKYLSEIDSAKGITDYHKMYGEAVCMRSWAYFNAARIYNEIPYIPETITEYDKIVEYVNTPGTYIDSSYIQFSPNGLYNDTIVKVYEAGDKMLLDQDVITRKCIQDIENNVEGAGVDYGREYDDDTWLVNVWNEYAMYTLLGHMYLNIGDYTKAMDNFNKLLRYSEPGEDFVRFGLDFRYANDKWQNIFSGINKYEHIYSLWFGKNSNTFQRNPLQYHFSVVHPNIHSLQPTKQAVELWETLWSRYILQRDIITPENTYMMDPGIPGDYSRGNGVSFAYVRDGEVLSEGEWAEMMELKLYDKQNELFDFMEGIDTVVYKYTINKNPFSHDANFIVYRAAAIHLYAAEIYTNWSFILGGREKNYMLKAEEFIYTGNYKNDPRQLGVSGRVGFNRSLGISVDANVVYEFNPYNNEVVGYNVFETTEDKQLYLEEVILREKAREQAFEGERFYDILRIAKRRNERGLDGNKFLAEKISSKFSGSKKQLIKEKLLNESNWYITFDLN